MNKLILLFLYYCLFLVRSAFSIDFEAVRKEEWFACNNSSDCIVIEVGGCPYNLLAVNRNFEKESVDWAQAENARSDCMMVKKYSVENFKAECIKSKCEIIEKKESLK